MLTGLLSFSQSILSTCPLFFLPLSVTFSLAFSSTSFTSFISTPHFQSLTPFCLLLFVSLIHSHLHPPFLLDFHCLTPSIFVCYLPSSLACSLPPTLFKLSLFLLSDVIFLCYKVTCCFFYFFIYVSIYPISD